MTNELREILGQVDKIYKLGRRKEAEPILLEGAEKLKSLYGEDTTDYAAILNELGGLYKEISEYSKSEDAFLRAQKILSKVLGEEHPDYATTINNLAGLYRLMNKHEESEKLFKEAIMIYEKTLGKNHFLYASGLNNLGLLYQDLKRYREAWRLHEDALEIIKNLDNPIAYATTLNNLSVVYSHLGSIDEAEEMLKKASEIYKEEVGTEHPLYASSLNNLASFYIKHKKIYTPAKELYLQVLDICERVYGKDNYEYAVAAYNLKEAYEGLKRYYDAEIYMMEVVRIYRKIFGMYNPLYLESLEKLDALREKIAYDL